MAERQFKMLRKEGKGMPYPYTKTLMSRGDMKVVFMTKAEIDELVAKYNRTPEAPAKVEDSEPFEGYDAEDEPTPQEAAAAATKQKAMAGLVKATEARLKKAAERKAAEAAQTAEEKTEETDPLA